MPDSFSSPTAHSDSSTGIPANVAGALSYFLGPITGILFMVIEKSSRFVRFHAAQSVGVSVLLIVVNIVFMILSTVLAFVPVIGWLITLVAGLGLALVSLFLWLFLMFKAFSGSEWEMPIVGKYARDWADKPHTA